MRSWKRRGAAMAAVAAMAIGASVLSGGSSASGADPLSVTINTDYDPAPYGVLRLNLGASPYLRVDQLDETVDPIAVTPGTAHALTGNNQCRMQTTSTPVASFGYLGSRATHVGLVGGSIGVGGRGEGNGTPCGQVQGDQVLILSLPPGALAMDYAELDIEGKYGVTVRAQLYRNGALVYDTNQAGTGLDFTSVDSGPDSGINDNQRFTVDPPDPATGPPTVFDTIRLSVDPSEPNGAFALEGGGDGVTPRDTLGTALGTSESLFHLFNAGDTLDCGETVTVGDGTTAPKTTITLVAGLGCEPQPYMLETGVTSGGEPFVSFRKPVDDDATPNVFRATWVWTVEEAAYPVPPTKIIYDEDDPNDPLGHDLLWCDGTEAAPEALAGEPWCIYDQDPDLVADGLMQVTEYLLGVGDPFGYR